MTSFDLSLKPLLVGFTYTITVLTSYINISDLVCSAIDNYRIFRFHFFILQCFMGVDSLGTNVNDEGVTFYNNIINALLERGILST